ncbi:histidine phosphatase family protein [Marinicrinis lubricantis]|uniref:Histidine phosphatase family protein n=1 Tax=Marinicrinis lubricantis TaxID=2086470 RepID=A0ABW1IQY2_9BACL
MEIIFIRHGQGEHTLQPPASLNTVDPSLTEYGICQARQLSIRYRLTKDDLIIASPTRRTIQTALYWKDHTECPVLLHVAVGPRMFPLLPVSQAFPCDTSLSKLQLQNEFPNLRIYESAYTSWDAGINAIDEALFSQVAHQFIEWCLGWNKERIYIVSHDGTITSYRTFLGEASLTRKDFLGETGSYCIQITCDSKINRNRL